MAFKMLYTSFYIVCCIIVLSSCQIAQPIGSPVNALNLQDGEYDGFFRWGPNSATVRITTRGGKMETVTILNHFSSWKGNSVNEIIPKRIIEAQSTRVDAVSGATNSSIVIMNAVQKAVEKAY
ncbi:MAG: FMN-binding protein [Thermodesulfobacteriota bacterium]